MPVNNSPVRGLWLAGPIALSGLLAGGCSWLPHRHPAAPPPVVVRPVASTGDAADESAGQRTVTSDLPDLPETDEPAVAAAPAPTVVMADAGPSLAASAPKSYVVQKGDTLWGLANLYLKDPWQWPEIWYVNPEVKNPHRIYPGDTLRLAMGGDGRQQLQVVPTGGGEPVEVATPTGPVTVLHPMLREGAANAPIEVLPRAAIATFLSRPNVLAKEQVKDAPYVVALRDDHMIAGAGQDVYLRRVAAAEGARFDVMHVGVPLHARGVGKVGYLAQYAGTVQVARPGDPARGLLTETAREVLTGDVLLPVADNDLGSIVPHVPNHAVDGRLLAVVDGTLLAGQYQVVALSGGSVEGIEPGHVLRVAEAPKRVRDRCGTIEGTGTCLRFRDIELPSEVAGTLLVFRSFEHMSYALVMAETVPLHVGDHVVRP